MRNSVRLAIIYITFIWTTFGCTAQKKLNTATNDVQIDSLRKMIREGNIEVDSLAQILTLLNGDKRQPDSIERRQTGIYILNDREHGLGLKDMFAILLSFFALLISYLVMRNTRWNKNLDFISEIDKQFISDPGLWAVYDVEKDNYPINRVAESETPNKRTLGLNRGVNAYKFYLYYF